jgi:hypothetical protein
MIFECILGAGCRSPMYLRVAGRGIWAAAHNARLNLHFYIGDHAPWRLMSQARMSKRRHSRYSDGRFGRLCWRSLPIEFSTACHCVIAVSVKLNDRAAVSAA